ncbi:hypothetical protein ElyMa_000383500 [Elysia marginata]|uniref:Uncharacterized protein n=1 Tax=Elysia marginata TaxID=1093978 RepID=A0AAV4FGX3_9GAST|nr:hypothetical protein ElyMa_000383500 [Elysia marginata]
MRELAPVCLRSRRRHVCPGNINLVNCRLQGTIVASRMLWFSRQFSVPALDQQSLEISISCRHSRYRPSSENIEEINISTSVFPALPTNLFTVIEINN